MCEKALKENLLQDVPGTEIDLYVGDQYVCQMLNLGTNGRWEGSEKHRGCPGLP